jgi:hypothetical protein
MVVGTGFVAATLVWVTMTPFDAGRATADTEGLTATTESEAAASPGEAIRPDLDKDIIRAALAASAPLPASVAADGKITWEEYEAAIWKSVECMENAGLEMRFGPELDVSGKILRYGVNLTGDANEDARIRKAADECEARHAAAVKVAWGMAISPTTEQMQAARAALAECLINGGTPPEFVNEERLIDAEIHSRGLFPVCANQVSAEFGIPHFGG